MTSPGMSSSPEDAFVGRSSELATLNECALRAAGGAYVAVSVEGEAGIGKTALISRFISQLNGFTVFRALCDAAEKDIPYGVVGQLLRGVPSGILRRYPVLAGIVAEPGAVPGPPVLSTGVQLTSLLGELLDTSPVALVIDDLHWVDWPSLQALRTGCRRLHGDRLLVMASAGEQASGQDLMGHQQFLHEAAHPVKMVLSGLDTAAVMSLANAWGRRWSLQDIEELRTRTDGNPLYIRSVLAEARTAGFDEPAWVLGNGVPEPLAAVLRRRLDVLTPQARCLVEALAVLDAWVPLETAAHVAGLDTPEQVLKQLIAQGIVQRASHDASDNISLSHRLQRDAVYATLPPTRRRELHRAAAGQMQGPAVWAHRVAAAESGETAALARDLETEAMARIATGDPDMAATWLLWAADLSPTAKSRERRLLTAALHLLAGRRIDRAQRFLGRVRQCAASSLKDCVFGMYAAAKGDFATAERLLSDVMSAHQRDCNLEWVAWEAANVLGALYAWRGDGPAVIKIEEEVLASAGDRPAVVAPALSYLLTGHLLRDGPRAALEYFEHDPVFSPSRSPEQKSGSLSSTSYCLAWSAICRVLVGQFDLARKDARSAIRNERPGRTDAWTGDLAYYALAAAEYWNGEWDQAATHADRAVALALSREHPWTLPRAYAVSAFIASGRGEWAKAEEAVEAAEDWVRVTGPDQYVIFPAMARAILAQARQDDTTMLAALQPLLALPDSSAWRSIYRPWWLPLHIEALIGNGLFREASSHLDALRTLSAEHDYLEISTLRLTGRLLSAQGDPAHAANMYRSALRFGWASDVLPFQKALLAQDYANALSDLGDEAASHANWHRAYQAFCALGAHPFMLRCEAELTSALRGPAM